jgi:hypothetical protein
VNREFDVATTLAVPKVRSATAMARPPIKRVADINRMAGSILCCFASPVGVNSVLFEAIGDAGGSCRGFVAGRIRTIILVKMTAMIHIVATIVDF